MKYAKAWVAFVLAVVTVLGYTLADNAVDDKEISQGLAVVIDAVLVLITALGVRQVPNAKAPNSNPPVNVSAQTSRTTRTAYDNPS